MTTVPLNGGAWEDLRKEARRLESELDYKLSSYAKLCSTFEANYKLNSSDSLSLGAEQAQTRADEIRKILQQLSDVNEELSNAIGGSSDSRSHILARHRDILLENTQEFQKITSNLGAARDRAQLLSGIGDVSPLLSVQVQGSSGALLRERGILQNSSMMVDSLLAQSTNVSNSLLDQKRVLESASDKFVALGMRFPAVNGVINAIRRKKSKDTLVLSAVVTACVLFTLIYLFFR